ncbi:class I SAM-dependent methyltransferase [Streptomyces sp. TS71-3]|uniref:class I SAM-dependent methyltransferase n=1 Tax=Streptomyces sp. TS71-3 TaxID=2733862 RepID=UPI001B002621|nr:class I SAM-dependent methyltransferase [Streptomyces sp. TS71-3]GHJ34441.1 S-adenosyl-L-methionine-dependent methyltransferase [Streptomyces sp. TS71-3]
MPDRAAEGADGAKGPERPQEPGRPQEPEKPVNPEKPANPENPEEPESSAVRVALWRALHVQADPPPHVLVDEVGLRLAAPDAGWRSRPDMDVTGPGSSRASIVVRARFVEDLVVAEAGRGVGQYVILGAGLDTFAQRRPEAAAGVRVFEVDQPGPQAWKRRRLEELGLGVPEWLRLVPVDFEADGSWPERLAAAGFDTARPAVVAATGVSMYLTREANADLLRRVAALAPGTTLAMTFLPPLELVGSGARAERRATESAARSSGTPFISSFAPRDMLALAREAGFRAVRHVPLSGLADRYFGGRQDRPQPPGWEELLVATV